MARVIVFEIEVGGDVDDVNDDNHVANRFSSSGSR